MLKNTSASGHVSRALSLGHPAHFEKIAPKLFHALNIIQAYSALGRRLYDWARDTDQVFMEEAMEKRMGVGGAMVVCNSGNTLSAEVGIVAHELMHAMQHRVYNLMVQHPATNARGFIIHGRGLEAAAVTCQIRVLYEMKLNGFTRPWNDFMAGCYAFKTPEGKEVNGLEGYRPVGQSFAAAYKQAQRAGKSTNQAMDEACDAAHEAYFKNAGLATTYNNVYIKDYLHLLFQQGGNTTPPQPLASETRLHEMTRIGENEYLVRSGFSYMPKCDAEIFFGNEKMRQAFDYIETVRMMNVYGKDGQGFKEHMHKLVQEKNPYIGINLKKALAVMQDEKDPRTSLQILDDMAKELQQQKKPQQVFASVANDNRGQGKIQKRLHWPQNRSR
ncbi:MAG: hypothetical protein EA357_00560 [Micavibrio sp.]|nr:MAG: hypothetical protein EA357_00560 [Micavibrio sp.]